MKNSDNVVLYVGKACNLRKRVSTYFRGGDGRFQLDSLMEQVASLETIITEDERQALILENDLIKKHQPHYNIKLKDGKAYIVIRVDINNKWPRLEVFRQTQDDGAKYFGPYAFSFEIKTLLEIINQTAMLRTCSDKVLNNRVRPCLEYQIKRCSAPCCNLITILQYQEQLKNAFSILEGRNDNVVEKLSEFMEKASADLRFEDATRYRDSIGLIKKMQDERNAFCVNFQQRDVIGFYREGDRAEISIMQIRNGRLNDVQSFGFSELVMNDEELLGAFLTQYYAQAILIPEEIILPFALKDKDLREEIITKGNTKKVKILIPRRSENVKILKVALDNARENYLLRFSGSSDDRILENLKNAFELPDLPRIIECIDISHISGTDTVASVVCFKDSKPDKSRYRKFKLSAEIEGKPDDFASMREVLRRHLSRCAEENTLADLIIIDGGKQQLSQGLAIKKELGLTSPIMVGLAKKREGKHKMLRSLSALEVKLLNNRTANLRKQIRPERVFLENKDEPVVLNPSSAEEYLIERIRDEAHRFAITFHRELRAKRVQRSVLSQIPGVGKTRQVQLLKEFGSVQKICETTAEEINKRCGIPLNVANKIIERLALQV